MPVATPVTRPVLETVAIPVLPEAQALLVAAVALPVNCVVTPTQTEFEPVIVGFALTVIV